VIWDCVETQTYSDELEIDLSPFSFSIVASFSGRWCVLCGGEKEEMVVFESESINREVEE